MELDRNDESMNKEDIKEEEVWKPVIGYEGIYEISNYGRCKSLSRPLIWGRVSFIKKEMMMKESLNDTGYVVYSFRKDNKRKDFKAHRLVGLHFIINDDPDVKTDINHKDCNKLNNYYKNLEWMTRANTLLKIIDFHIKLEEMRLDLKER